MFFIACFHIEKRIEYNIERMKKLRAKEWRKEIKRNKKKNEEKKQKRMKYRITEIYRKQTKINEKKK